MAFLNFVFTSLVLTAPAGWIFKQSGVTAAVVNGLPTGNSGTNVSVDNAKIGYTAATITIPFVVDKTNQRDKVTISGVEVQAINGANIPATGSITLSSNNTVSGLPTTLSPLSQKAGAAKKIAFGTQPANTPTGNVITGVNGSSPTVLIQDQFNNTVTSGTGANAQVTVAIGTKPAGSNGILSGTTTVPAANGVATFSNLKLDAAGTGYILSASTSSYGNALSSAFNINSQVPTLVKPTACITEGAVNTVVALTGTNFEKNSVVQVNGNSRTTTYTNSTQLSVELLDSDLTTAGDLTLTVLNPGPPANNFSTPQILAIKPLLKAAAIVGEREVCAGNQAVYQAPAGFHNYSWSASEGGSIVASTANPAVANFSSTVPVSGKVTITLNALNECNVPSTVSFDVTVKQTPPAVIEYESRSFCEGGSLELRAFINPANTDNYNYKWFKLGANDVYSLVGENLPNYEATTAGTYRLTVTGTNACSQTSDPVTITVNPLPTVSIGTLNSEYCSSDPAVSLEGTPAGGSFRILKNGSEVATGASLNPASLGAGVYTIEYSYSDANTCVNTATKSVTIKQQPTVTLTSDLEICPGESAALTASGADTYIWSPATGLSATSGASVTAKPTQTTTYTVTGTTNGCQAVAKTVTVTVNPLPDVTITLRGPAEFCPNSNTDLVAINTPGYTYEWFRLNSNGSSTVVSASAEGPYIFEAEQTGSYYVRITTDKGCTLDSEPIAVKVANVPTTASISIVGATTFCKGGAVKFSANQSPTAEPYVYQWQKSTTTTDDGAFSDISDATASSSSYTATTAGYYRVLVSNTSTADATIEKCTKISEPVQVTVLPQPTAQIVGGDQTICRDPSGTTSFFLEGDYSGGTASWYVNKGGWSIVDLTNPTTGKTSVRVDVPEGNPAASATITLKSSNSASSCAPAASSVNLIINSIPNTTISANRSTTLCRGESVTLNANPQTGNYLWSNGATTRSITVKEAGSYTVTVTNSSGCPIESAPTEVIVNELPEVSIITELNNAYCQSDAAVPLVGNQTGGTFRILRGTTVIVPNTNQFEPGILTAGTYTVEYSYTDGNTCTNTATKEVVVNPTPTVNAISSVTLCNGAAGAAIVFGSPVNGTTYTWTSSANVGFGTGSSTAPATGIPAFTASNTTNAPVTATVTVTPSANGCPGTPRTFSVTVNPTTTVNAISSVTLCNGAAGAAIVFGSPVNGTTYTWTSSANVGFGTGSSTAPATGIPAFTASNTTNAPVTATVTVMPSANGCPGTPRTFTVTVNPTPTVNTISNVTLCNGAAGAAIVFGSPVNGTTYTWTSSANVGFGTGSSTTPATGIPAYTASNSTNAPVTATVTVTPSANNCPGTPRTFTVTVNPNQPVTFTGTLASTSVFYTGQSAVTLSANLTGGTFFGPGVSGTTFNPCTAGAGTHTITYTRGTGSCTSTVSKIVTVVQSTYRAVITANPHPFCKGAGGTTYTTAVYRDVQPGEIIYPYLVNANGQPVDRAGNPIAKGAGSFPVANPDYPFPSNTPESVKALAYRFFQPQVSPALAARKIDQGVFEYQWAKNDEQNRKNGLYQTKDAGLSSQDYYNVQVTSTSACAGVNLESNRMYTAALDDYNVVVTATPNPICPGQAVTFLATLGTPDATKVFPWDLANVKVAFVLTRVNNSSVTLGTVSYDGSITNGLRTVSITTDYASAGGFVNGDQVSAVLTSDIDRFFPSNNCAGLTTSTPVTINVVLPQAMTGGGAYCVGGAGVPVGLSSSQIGVSYQLMYNGSNIGTAVAGTGSAISFGNQTAEGTYTVKPTTASGSACVVFGSVNVSITPLPTLFAVTGGGEYCAVAGATGVPIGLSGSQQGVSYQLLLNNAAVGSPVAGTGNAISFGNKTAAGTYTVTATTVSSTTSTPPVASCPQTMTGSKVVTVNALPELTLTSPAVCQGSKATVSASATGGSGSYTYKWTVPEGVEVPNTATSTFQTDVPGKYSVEVTDGKTCSVTATTTVIINQPQLREESVLEATWNKEMTQWEVKVVENSPLVKGELGLGANPTITWYRRVSPQTDWGSPVQTGTSITYIENNPGNDVQIKAVLLNPSSCILYELNNIGVTPLPVEIIYLRANKQGNDVLLEWATAMEQDNAGFEVQVSTDGFTYRKLAFVASRNGNASTKQVYTFTDRENGKYGTRYYRLKQQDIQGTFEYFGPKAVSFGSVASKVIAFPNPFHDEVTLDIASEEDGQALVVVTDAVGKTLLERKVRVSKGFTTEKLRLDANLPNGMYIIRTQVGGVTQYLKMIKE